MKRDILELKDGAIENIFLVRAKFELHSYGRIWVHQCKKLVLRDRKQKRVALSITGDQFVCALQEPSHVKEGFREREPYDRQGKNYVRFFFKDMEIWPTVNGSRFLVLKERRSFDQRRMSFTVNSDELVTICDSQDLCGILSNALDSIGVPKTDQKIRLHDILAKMGQ
jgi:hypothetical protein